MRAGACLEYDKRLNARWSWSSGLCTHGRTVRGRQWCNGLRVLDGHGSPLYTGVWIVWLDNTHGEFAGQLGKMITETLPRRRERPVNSIAYLSRTNQCLAPCDFPMLISHKKSLDRGPSAWRACLVVRIACVIYDLLKSAICCNTRTSSCAQFFVSSARVQK